MHSVGQGAQEILAAKCSESGATYLPPRAYCERSFAQMRRMGRVRRASPNETATIVSAQFESPPKSPWCIGYVRLDRASTAMVNFIEEFNMSDLQAASARVGPAVCVKMKWIDKSESKAIDFYYALA
jgi:uncharacterized OB-fold protein